MKKILNILLIALILLLPVKVLAESGEIDTTPVDEIGEEVDSAENHYHYSYNNEVDNIMTDDISIGDISEKIDKKLWQIAGILQKWSIPISITTFIVGCFLMISGALSKKGGIAPGVITCAISIIVYTLCTNAPAIVVAVSKWLIE